MGDTLTMFEQADIARGNQTVPHFNECLDDVAEHVFPEKAGQIQKKLHAEKSLIYQGPHHEGMGSSSTRAER
eukprot:12383760-Ditylum_brightwellii.AAC.1